MSPNQDPTPTFANVPANPLGNTSTGEPGTHTSDTASGTEGIGSSPRFCTQCGAQLAPGVKFCHRCGHPIEVRPTAANASKTLATTLPWAVAGIAFLALFAMLAGRGFNQSRGSSLDAPANALPNPELDRGPMGPMMGGGGMGQAPDISSMDPAELADRLYNRVLLLHSEGKADSLQFFASMAIQAYQMLQDAQAHAWDQSQRYEVGNIASVAGALPLAKAQADTILQIEPNHLLGLLLAANVAKMSGNTPAYDEYSTHFNRVRTTELARKRPEYERHSADLTTGP